MKIKEICAQTGLTDRTIRFYIEQGLISPAYTENYLGRKSFDFSQDDAGQLNAIATLRSFGFTVEEIRQLQDTPLRSQQIIAQVRERKRAAASIEQENLALLDRLGKLTDYSVLQLADALYEAAARAELPQERYQPDGYDIASMLTKGILYGAVMLAPVGFLIHWLTWYWTYHRYAAFSWSNAVCILLALVPAAVLLLAWLRPKLIKRRTRAWVLCLLCLPLSWLLAKNMLGDSVTTDIRYYRAWDFYVNEDNKRLNELFPAQVRAGWNKSKSIYEDSDYFYRARAEGSFGTHSFWENNILNAYEVYAEWMLPAELLRPEIARVESMFQVLGHDIRDWYATKCQQGSFTCWIMDFAPFREHDPFGAQWNGGSVYLLFAYDEQTGRVRYGAGKDFSAGWKDYPHFRMLEWK